MIRCPLTQEELKVELSYCAETGVFTRRNHRRGVIGATYRGRYLFISIRGRRYPAHCLAWLYVTGEYPAQEVDHIDWNGRNNRFDNLRLAGPDSRTMNMANMPLKRNNTTGAKGVRLQPWGRYQARLCIKGKTYDAGCFDTIDEAAHAYNKLAVQHFGEFAVLNPIGEDYVR